MVKTVEKRKTLYNISVNHCLCTLVFCSNSFIHGFMVPRNTNTVSSTLRSYTLDTLGRSVIGKFCRTNTFFGFIWVASANKT